MNATQVIANDQSVQPTDVNEFYEPSGQAKLKVTPEMVMAVLVELDAIDWHANGYEHLAFEYDGEDVVACQAARRLIFRGGPARPLIDWALAELDRITPVHTADRTAELSACAGLRAIILAVRHGHFPFATKEQREFRELLDNAAMALVTELPGSQLANKWCDCARYVIAVAYCDADREPLPDDDEHDNATSRLAREAGELALHVIRAVYDAETPTLNHNNRVNSDRALADLRALAEVSRAA